MLAESPLEIVINGRFLSQRLTGVQRVAEQFTRAFDRLLSEGAFPMVSARLVAESGSDPGRLGLQLIDVEIAPGAAGHIWEQFILPRRVRGGSLLCLGNSAPIATLLSRRPPAVMLHDQAHLLFPGDYSLPYRIFHRLNEAAVIRHARPLLLVSEAEKRVVECRHSAIAPHRIVTPNGSWGDDAKVDLSSAELSADRYGLFIGAPSRRKNIDGVLSTAISLARSRAHRFQLVGPDVDHLRVRVPSDVAHLIEFRGYIRDDELPDLYRNAAYLLFPSFYEASGLPLSEAMTFGCPIVASDLPVTRERCGKAAIYCDPHDANSIRQAVDQLLGDPIRMAELRRLGPCQAAQFTWRRQAELIVGAICANRRSYAHKPL